MKKTILAITAAAALAACAQSPSAIAPVSMGNAFASVSCSNAQAGLTAERANLASLSTAQKSAVAGDAVGVFLIGVPLSSLSGGDKAGEIATSKGKIVALENRLMNC